LLYKSLFNHQSAVRGTIIDTTSDGDSVGQSSDIETIVVSVSPVADCLATGNIPDSFMVEDIQDAPTTTNANVGNIINTALSVEDNGISTATVENNNVREYLSRVELLEIDASPMRLDFLPTNITNLAVSDAGSVSGLGPNGSGILDYDLTTNSFNITSSIIEMARTPVTPLGGLTDTQLQDAEQDIRAVLNAFVAKPRISESDLNGKIGVTVTTIDVNPVLMKAAEISCTKNHNVIIQAYADPVSLTVEQPLTKTYTEDDENATEPWKLAGGIPLKMSVDSSFDNTDGSEYLEIKITIPYDTEYKAPIGTLNYNSNSNITVTAPGTTGEDAVWTVAVNSALTAEQQEEFLNSYLASNLFFVPGDDWAGELLDTNGIKVELFSIEKATGNELKLKSTNDTEYISIDMLPVVSRM
jgi:hypothetical protein